MANEDIRQAIAQEVANSGHDPLLLDDNRSFFVQFGWDDDNILRLVLRLQTIQINLLNNERDELKGILRDVLVFLASFRPPVQPQNLESTRSPDGDADSDDTESIQPSPTFGECIRRNELQSMLGAWQFRYKHLTLALTPEEQGIFIAWIIPTGHVIGCLHHVHNSNGEKDASKFTMGEGELVFEDGSLVNYEMIYEKSNNKATVHIQPKREAERDSHCQILMSPGLNNDSDSLPTAALHFILPGEENTEVFELSKKYNLGEPDVDSII